MPGMNFKKIRITYWLIALLAILFFAGLLWLQTPHHLWHFLLLAGPSIVMWWVLRRLKVKGLGTPDDLIISCLIMTLLTTPANVPWYIVAISGLTLLAVKTIIRPFGKPLFNPAAITLLLWSFYPGFNISWWGLSFVPGIWLIILSAGLYFAYSLRKLNLAIFFAVIYFVVSLAFLSWIPDLSGTVLARQFIDGAFWFFVLIMMLEPKTSPFNKKDQRTTGIVAGFLLPWLSAWLTFDSWLFTIMLVNLMNFAFSWRRSRPIKAV